MMYYSETVGLHYGDPLPDSVPCDESHPAYIVQQNTIRNAQTVSMYQARIALQQAGLLATVQAGISQMSEEAQIKWEFAPTVKRNDSLTTAMAAALNLSEAQLDGLFTTAAGIV